MRKKIALFAICAAGLMSLAACGPEESTSKDVSGNITADPLNNLGLDEQYLPAKDSIKLRSGKINVCLEYEGTEEGWEALADEYMRLHGDQVVVNIKTPTGAYVDYIKNQQKDLDIIQGNYFTDIENRCQNLYSYLNKENGYCGKDGGDVRFWQEVLEEEAYSSSSNSLYMVNSENLQTCFFVNTIALNDAANNGYSKVDASGNPANPETWDELISLATAMKAAGYSNPIGLSLDSTSCQSNQFTWLLRVYGDYYFRNEYKNIVNNPNFKYDPAKKNIEEGLNFSYKDTTLFNAILDDKQSDAAYESLYPNYVGPRSAKHKEFFEQFHKLRGLLQSDAATQSQEQIRTRFQAQSDKSAPQIMLDYAGEGLIFSKSQKLSNNIDFFDYPKMISAGNYIDEGTIVRDVGGSGGYLSAYAKSNDAQNQLNADFIKFVMSPYGQTIYYDAISQTTFAPKGLTTVKSGMVVVPTEWQSYFNTDKISFNGLVDKNPFVFNMTVGLGSRSETKNALPELWQGYLVNTGSDEKNTDAAVEYWYGKLFEAWESYCDAYSFNKTSYLRPGTELN